MQNVDKLAQTKHVRRTRLELKRVARAIADADSLGCSIGSMDIDTACDKLLDVEQSQLLNDVGNMKDVDVLANAGRIARLVQSYGKKRKIDDSSDVRSNFLQS